MDIAILGPASRSIPHIDLYVHTGIFLSARTQLVSKDVAKSIEEGYPFGEDCTGMSVW